MRFVGALRAAAKRAPQPSNYIPLASGARVFVQNEGLIDFLDGLIHFNMALLWAQHAPRLPQHGRTYSRHVSNRF